MYLYNNLKYGIAIHYLFGGVSPEDTDGIIPEGGFGARYPDGTMCQSVDEVIDNFNVEQFAADCAAFGVEYVSFTSHHAGWIPIYKSNVYKNSIRPSKTNPRNIVSTEKDLIKELSIALGKHGIKLLLYTHPQLLHGISAEDQAAFKRGTETHGAGTFYADNYGGTYDYELLKNYILSMYRELISNYHEYIIGIIVDDPLADTAENTAHNIPLDEIREIVKSIDPSLIMIMNYRFSTYSCDNGIIEDVISWHSPGSENSNPKDADWWLASDYPGWSRLSEGDCLTYGFSWVARITQETEAAKYLPKAEDLYRYTVLQAGTNTRGGGMAWAFGNFAGLECSIWEPGVYELMTKVYSYIHPIEKSIKGTVPSKSYPTDLSLRYDNPEYKSWDNIDACGINIKILKEKGIYGVATESIDGGVTYMHVLNPSVSAIDGNTLVLSLPADGKLFSRARLLIDGMSLLLAQDDAGIKISLPKGTQWDNLNTVIELS
ncbi:MAG: alpha-L-fucosidase [Defluviitaleaceae bacterium]|nr:alpha-L-fucosidase [Defluviitaleaceae bacterium]